MQQDRDPPPQDEQSQRAEWFRYTGIGFEFIAAVLVCTAIGFGLDRWLGWSPWGLLGGVGIGFALGLFQLVRAAKRIFHD